MQPDQFKICVKLDGLKLVPQGVFVVWKWEWSDSDSESSDNDSLNQFSDEEKNPYLLSESDEEALSKSDAEGNSLTHTITFKCMGSNYHPESQSTLSKVSELLRNGQVVPVQLSKEPDNEYDSQAITFQCQLESHWRCIGYVVKEALPAVHDVLNKKKIVSINFDWVKYLVNWSKSGPGFYAGIKISLNGKWPVEVWHCRST